MGTSAPHAAELRRRRVLVKVKRDPQVFVIISIP
jgi:hypothetical protein